MDTTMICGVCKEEVEPHDSHMGRINGKLDVYHIKCWNEHVDKREGEMLSEK